MPETLPDFAMSKGESALLSDSWTDAMNDLPITTNRPLCGTSEAPTAGPSMKRPPPSYKYAPQSSPALSSRRSRGTAGPFKNKPECSRSCSRVKLRKSSFWISLMTPPPLCDVVSHILPHSAHTPSWRSHHQRAQVTVRRATGAAPSPAF